MQVARVGRERVGAFGAERDAEAGEQLPVALEPARAGIAGAVVGVAALVRAVVLLGDVAVVAARVAALVVIAPAHDAAERHHARGALRRALRLDRQTTGERNGDEDEWRGLPELHGGDALRSASARVR